MFLQDPNDLNADPQHCWKISTIIRRTVGLRIRSGSVFSSLVHNRNTDPDPGSLKITVKNVKLPKSFLNIEEKRALDNWKIPVYRSISSFILNT